jgi:hypothetical protein
MKRIVLALLWLAVAGCTTPARDQRDPGVWRPRNPTTYPIPR